MTSAVASGWNADAPVSVRQLLALPRLAEAELLGGGNGREQPVTRVVLAPSERHPVGLFEEAAVLMAGGRLDADNYLVDTTLGWMEEAGAALLIVVSPAQEVALSSRRLADKFGIGLVSIEDDLLDLADALREVVEAPQRIMSRAIVDAVDRLGRVSPGHGVEDSLAAIDGTIGSRSTVVAAEGETIIGDALDPPLALKDRLSVPVATSIGDVLRLVQPVILAPGERPSFWLVVEATSPTHAWHEIAVRVAQVATSYIATGLIATRLVQERDARFRLGMLNSLIALTGTPSSALLKQLGTLGWKTDGWCTALHIRLSSTDSAKILGLTSELSRVLSRAGWIGPMIERADGWTCWRTDVAAPASTTFGDLTLGVRRALQEFAADRDGLRIYAGIGRPYLGLLGLKKSLEESHEAATIAQASGRRTGVQHVDELGVEKILVGWYTSQEFGDFAHALLRSVVAIDSDDVLVRTLEVYLDNESSPTATADILGLHRNTVNKRIARIKEVLTVELDDPDQRLAVQLACRVLNLDQ